MQRLQRSPGPQLYLRGLLLRERRGRVGEWNRKGKEREREREGGSSREGAPRLSDEGPVTKILNMPLIARIMY